MRIYRNRIIALFLCLCIFLTSIPVWAEEFDKFGYYERVAERYWESFEEDDGAYFNNLMDNKRFEYVLWADAIDAQGKIKHGFLWATNFLLDKKWNVEAYAGYLSTILSLMDRGFEESVLAQASYTAKVSMAEYAGDVFEMSIEQFLGAAKLKQLEESMKIFFDIKDLAVLGGTKLSDATQLYVYSVASASYDKKRAFLETLKNYTEDDKLKEAADDILKLVDLEFCYIMLNYKEEFLKDAVELGLDTANASISKDILPMICKNVSEKFVPWLLKHGDIDGAVGTLMLTELAKKYATVIGLVAETMLLTGKTMALFVGDQAEMFREMKVMDSISDTLTKALLEYNNQIAQNSGEDQYNAIFNYVTAGEALAYTHLRGEYCMTEIKKHQGENAAKVEKELNKLTKVLNKSYESFNRILPDSEIKYVVNEKFKLKEGFIKEVRHLKVVPEGYIGIYDFSDLMSVRSNPGLNYILMNDIQCEPYDLVPNYVFTGVFNGNGYTIKNMNQALFGQINEGVVKNLGMQIDVAVLHEVAQYQIGNSHWGSFARYAKNSTFDNCYVEGNIYITEENGDYIALSAGGLVGAINNCSITNCYNRADITVDYVRGSVNVGGLIGETNSFNFRKISNSFNEGKIVSRAEQDSNARIGGICGDSNNMDYINCYNAGDVTAYDSNNMDGHLYGSEIIAGGICGIAGGASNIMIRFCWNSGTIKAQNEANILQKKEDGGYFVEVFNGYVFAGGILGRSGEMNISKCMNIGDIDARSYAGGIVGDASNGGYLMDSYNTGRISGNYLAGGILGIGGCGFNSGSYDDESIEIQNCYSLGEVSKEALAGGAFAGYLGTKKKCLYCFTILENGTNITTTEMQIKGIELINRENVQLIETYEGYDFEKIWRFEEESEIPVKLRFE